MAGATNDGLTIGSQEEAEALSRPESIDRLDQLLSEGRQLVKGAEKVMQFRFLDHERFTTWRLNGLRLAREVEGPDGDVARRFAVEPTRLDAHHAERMIGALETLREPLLRGERAASAAPIQDLAERRDTLLKTLCEIAHGDPGQRVDAGDLARTLGWPLQEVRGFLRQLVGARSITVNAAMSKVRITADGVRAAEAIARRPEVTESMPDQANEVAWVLSILGRFKVAVDALADHPRTDRTPWVLAIEDEYDVQDLLFALLKPSIPDLEREDPVSKTAGVAGRVDLSAPSLGLVVEVKFPRLPGRTPARMQQECRERIPIYARWPDLRHLVFFAYDPSDCIKDKDNIVAGFTDGACTQRGRTFSVDFVIAPWHAGRDAAPRR